MKEIILGYTLDYKVNKSLDISVNKVFNLCHQCLGDSLNNNQKLLLNQAIACFVRNANLHLAQGDRYIQVPLNNKYYSKPLIYNGVKVNRKVSCKYTRIFLDWLSDNGFINLNIGYVKQWGSDVGIVIPKEMQPTTVEILDPYLELVDGGGRDLTLLESVIDLKDCEGELTTYRKNQNITRMITTLNTYNSHAKTTDIAVDGERFFVQAKRVFNDNSWECGGRFYPVGSRIMTNLMKKEKRKDMLINGNPTVEIDYKHLHPSIIAELEGYEFQDNYDPYGIILEGFDKDCLRSVAKIGLLCCINSRSHRIACQATSLESGINLPLQDWQAQGLIPKPMGIRQVIKELNNHNPYADNYFYSGKGLMLQNIDSRMMDYIIEYWNERQVFVLPIHDSVVIEEKYLAACMQVMRDAYDHVMGSTVNLRLKVEK